MWVRPCSTWCSGFQRAPATGSGSGMCQAAWSANAMARISTWAWSWSCSHAVSWGSMPAMAKLSACIRPSVFIEPEQSARMKTCSGRRDIPPPGMIVTLSGMPWPPPPRPT